MKRGQEFVKTASKWMLDKLNSPRCVAKGDWNEMSDREIIAKVREECYEFLTELGLYEGGQTSRYRVEEEFADVLITGRFLMERMGK